MTAKVSAGVPVPILGSSVRRATSTAHGSTPAPAARSTSTTRRRARRSARCRSFGARRDARARSTPPHARFPRGARKTAKERAAVMRRWFDLMMANQEDLAQLMTAEQGKPLAESRGEVGLRGVVPRVVRRGSQARLRRHHSRPSGRQAHRRHQGADRRRRLHHAVEFPARDDHAQGRPGDRRRLHGGAEAGVADAVLGAGAGRARRARRRAAAASSTSSPDPRPRSAAS